MHRRQLPQNRQRLALYLRAEFQEVNYYEINNYQRENKQVALDYGYKRGEKPDLVQGSAVIDFILLRCLTTLLLTTQLPGAVKDE